MHNPASPGNGFVFTLNEVRSLEVVTTEVKLSAYDER